MAIFRVPGPVLYVGRQSYSINILLANFSNQISDLSICFIPNLWTVIVWADNYPEPLPISPSRRTFLFCYKMFSKVKADVSEPHHLECAEELTYNAIYSFKVMFGVSLPYQFASLNPRSIYSFDLPWSEPFPFVAFLWCSVLVRSTLRLLSLALLRSAAAASLRLYFSISFSVRLPFLLFISHSSRVAFGRCSWQSLVDCYLIL